MRDSHASGRSLATRSTPASRHPTASLPAAPQPALAMAASTFFFRAVASDGKVRTGSLTGDNEKWSRANCANRG